MAKTSMVKRMALSAGILWGAGIFLLGVFSAATGGTYGAQFIGAIGSIYLGYSATYAGAAIGGILAFLDGAAAGAIFAYLYSRIR